MIPPEVPISRSATDAWLSVSDDLLWGFNHALSNRLAAITSIARILEYSDTGLDSLLSALSGEITSLEDTLKLLRLVPRDPRAPAEPVLLEDLVPEVVRLHELRTDVADLGFETDFEGEPQPVWIQPGRLAHTLLIGLATASRVAIAVGNRVVLVRVRATGDVVSIEVVAKGHDQGARLGGLMTDFESQAMGELIADAGGEFDEVGGGGEEEERGVAIRLPTLVAVRARERDRAEP